MNFQDYTIQVYHDEDGYVAKVLELPGCITQADSWAELGEMLDDAIKVWIEAAEEDGLDVPVPVKVERKEIDGETILAAGNLRVAREHFTDGDAISIWYPFPDSETAGVCFDMPDSDRQTLIALLEAV